VLLTISLECSLLLVPADSLHHPRPGEAELVLTGATHDDMVQDADVLEGLGDLVGGVDVLLQGARLLSGVRFLRSGRVWKSSDHELVRRHPRAEQVAIMSKTGGE